MATPAGLWSPWGSSWAAELVPAAGIWSWLPPGLGVKVGFAAGVQCGIFVGCAGATLFRSYFMLFQLALAFGLLGVVWVI